MRLLYLGVFAIVLTGCGGGGGGGATGADGKAANDSAAGFNGSPDGIYHGTSDSRNVTALILDDGSYYLIYSVPNDPSTIGGFAQGTGTYSDNKFTSAEGTNYNLEENRYIGLQPFTLNFAPKASLSGNVGSITINASYSADYEQKASISSIVGTYTGIMGWPGANPPISFTIDAAGNISGGSFGGCPFAGRVQAKAQGNAYTLSITLGAAGSPLVCMLGNGNTFSGAAYFDPTTKKLISVMRGGGGLGASFLATKP